MTTRAATAANVQSRRRPLDLSSRLIFAPPELRRSESRLSHRYSGAATSASTRSTLLSAAPSPNENTWNERL